MDTFVAQIRRRPQVFAVLAVIVCQLAFTAGIRGYVVPQMLPASHWQFGLQHLGDSQIFHERAVRIASAARTAGAALLFEDAGEQFRHAQIIAIVFYVTSSDNAWWIYVLNGFLAGISAWLMCLIAQASGLSKGTSAFMAALLGLSPQFLFFHSELLREPFILPPLQLAWLGCILFVLAERHSAQHVAWGQMVAASAALAGGFIASSTFRPYLMLPLLVALILVLALSLAWRLLTQFRESRWRVAHGLFAVVLVLLTFGFVAPSARRVQRYAETGGKALHADGPAGARPAGGWFGAAEDLSAPHACAVRWQGSGFLPDRIERVLESLACAREDFLLYCDPHVYGARIDRKCDMTPMASAGDLIRHLPYTTLFSLLAPFPDMWLDAFGAAGTGLRRVGYVVDGVISYVLLPGLLGLLVSTRGGVRPWPLVFVAVGIVVVIVAYAFAVPTQFILARMRLGFYRPLLVLAAVGWLRLIAQFVSTRRRPQSVGHRPPTVNA